MLNVVCVIVREYVQFKLTVCVSDVALRQIYDFVI